MMRSWKHRVRVLTLTLATGGLFAFNGCGLSDQQLASIWQSVLSTGLNTIVTSAISAAFSIGTTTT